MGLEETIQKIRLERQAQDRKWGLRKLVYGTHEKALAVAVEEFGEVAREMLEKKPGWQQRLKVEIIQIAAVMAAWHELGDWEE